MVETFEAVYNTQEEQLGCTAMAESAEYLKEVLVKYVNVPFVYIKNVNFPGFVSTCHSSTLYPEEP